MTQIDSLSLLNQLATLSISKPDTVIALAAATMAFATVILTAYQAFLSRKHNYLSVKPHLTTWINQNDSNGFYQIRCELLNNGLGPAILKRFKIFFDGKQIGDNTNMPALEEQITSILKQKPDIAKQTIATIGLNFPIPSGSRETLLEIQIPLAFGLDKKSYQVFFDKFSAVFIYNSMYGHRDVYHTYSPDDLKSWRLRMQLFLYKTGIIT